MRRKVLLLLLLALLFSLFEAESEAIRRVERGACDATRALAAS